MQSDPKQMDLAKRAVTELMPGTAVYLAPGLPTMVADVLPPHWGVTVLDAQMSHVLTGSSVDAVHWGGLLRGGHLNVAVLESVQVSVRGDLVESSQSGPSQEVVAYAGKVIAVMSLAGEDHQGSILPECTLPPSGLRRVHTVITDIGVFQISPSGLVLAETAPGWSVDGIRERIDADFVLATDLKEMSFEIPGRDSVSKIYPTAAEAVKDMFPGAFVMIDGFGGPGGMAHTLLVALRDQGTTGLTIISNSAGIATTTSFGTPPGFRAIDHSVLVENGQVAKAVASFPVSPSPSRPTSFEMAYKRGEAELELVPQGTLAERIRAGGSGIAAFYTPTGAGTAIAEGKPTRIIAGREHILERGLRADFALIRAHKADRLGNLVYRGTSRNFNPVMAPAADVTIVDVDEILEPGELDSEAIATPGLYVDRIVLRPPDFQSFVPVS